MAASSILVDNTLGVSYQTGVDSEGKDVFNGQSFKNISTKPVPHKIGRASWHRLLKLCIFILERRRKYDSKNSKYEF